MKGRCLEGKVVKTREEYIKDGTRHSVPAVKENTIMQKVIGQGAYDDYMLVDAAHPCNNPPCTGQGFVGDEDNLIPEYTYTYEDALNGKPITNGAIFKIDSDGKEYLAAYWDVVENNFIEVE